MAKKITTSIPEWLYKEIKARGLKVGDLIRLGYEVAYKQGITNIVALLNTIKQDVDETKIKVDTISKALNTIRKYIAKIALKQELTDEDIGLMEHWLRLE